MYSGRANNRSAAYAQGPGVYPPSPDQSRIRNEIIAVGGGAVLSNAVGDERSLVEQLRLQEEYDLRNALKASKKVEWKRRAVEEAKLVRPSQNLGGV